VRKHRWPLRNALQDAFESQRRPLIDQISGTRYDRASKTRLNSRRRLKGETVWFRAGR